MSKWGVNERYFLQVFFLNPRKLAAKEREQNQNEAKKLAETKAKNDAEWKITDKEELRALERKVCEVDDLWFYNYIAKRRKEKTRGV